MNTLAAPRPRHRRRAALALAVLASLTLTGCNRSEVALEIHGDGTVDGSAYLAILSTYPDLGQLVRSSSGVGALDPFDALPGSEIAPYRSSGFIGEQITFEGASWDSVEQALESALSAPRLDPVATPGRTPEQEGAVFRIEEIESDGGAPQLKLSGTNATLDEFVGYIGDFAATAAAGASPTTTPPQMNLVVTFPGRVLSTNGDQTGLDENTVSWNFDTYQQLDGKIEAIAENPPVTGPGFRETVRQRTLDVIDWMRTHLPAVAFLLLALAAAGALLRSTRRARTAAVPAARPSPDYDPHATLITEDEFARPKLVLIDGSPVAFDDPQPDDFLAPVPTEPDLILAPALTSVRAAADEGSADDPGSPGAEQER